MCVGVSINLLIFHQQTRKRLLHTHNVCKSTRLDCKDTKQNESNICKNVYRFKFDHMSHTLHNIRRVATFREIAGSDKSQQVFCQKHRTLNTFKSNKVIRNTSQHNDHSTSNIGLKAFYRKYTLNKEFPQYDNFKKKNSYVNNKSHKIFLLLICNK